MKILTILILIPLCIDAQNLSKLSDVKFLALGDSYTIGQNVGEQDRWPTQLCDSLRKKGIMCSETKIIATTGWRTDDLEKAIEQSHITNHYNLVSLLIGVNDFFQGRTTKEYAPAFKKLLHKAVELAGGNKSNVFVVSIPDYGFTPFGQSNQSEISRGIDDFNKTNRALTLAEGILYIDITDISRRGLDEKKLLATDGLHPSGKMYSEWVSRILKSLQFDRG